MFTGIIQEIGQIKKITPLGEGAIEWQVACSFAGSCEIDESISINGVCHTITAINAETFTVQSVEETRRKTTVSELIEGDYVNLERSLTLQAGLDGHLVQGHVDTIGTITDIEEEKTGKLITISYPKEFSKMIVERGSITVDGISLTVAREQNSEFTIAIIPYTWQHSNFKYKKAGDKVNLEFDIIGKYVMKYLAGTGRDYIG